MTDKVVPGFNFGGFGFGKQKEKGGVNLVISRPQESLPRKQGSVAAEVEPSLILSCFFWGRYAGYASAETLRRPRSDV
jgi:hypothetical protein